MDKIKRIGTVALLMICILGMLIIFGVMVSLITVKVTTRSSNDCSNFFLKNISIDTSFLSEIAQKYAVYENCIEKYRYYISNIEYMIENICTTSFPENDCITKVADSYYKKILNIDIKSIKRYGDEYPSDVLEAGREVVNLFDYCSDKEIFFLYIQTPGKQRYDLAYGDNKVITNNLMTDEIEKANMLISYLTENNVPIFNLSDDKNLMSELTFFESHWSCENALSATKLIEGYLYESGYIKNMQCNGKKYVDVLSSYTYGELGYEYSLPIPQKSDFYAVNINEKDLREGVFTEVFLKDKDTWNDTANLNKAYHNLWRLSNGNLTEIENKSKIKSDNKILLLGDSFSWPVSAYLSQTVRYFDTFHPQYFPGSIRKYIDLTQPDIVLLMYVDGQMDESIIHSAYGALAK